MRELEEQGQYRRFAPEKLTEAPSPEGASERNEVACLLEDIVSSYAFAECARPESGDPFAQIFGAKLTYMVLEVPSLPPQAARSNERTWRRPVTLMGDDRVLGRREG